MIYRFAMEDDTDKPNRETLETATSPSGEKH